jgi:hypothetical protein
MFKVKGCGNMIPFVSDKTEILVLHMFTFQFAGQINHFYLKVN